MAQIVVFLKSCLELIHCQHKGISRLPELAFTFIAHGSIFISHRKFTRTNFDRNNGAITIKKLCPNLCINYARK